MLVSMSVHGGCIPFKLVSYTLFHQDISLIEISFERERAEKKLHTLHSRQFIHSEHMDAFILIESHKYGNRLLKVYSASEEWVYLSSNCLAAHSGSKVQSKWKDILSWIIPVNFLKLVHLQLTTPLRCFCWNMSQYISWFMWWLEHMVLLGQQGIYTKSKRVRCWKNKH